MGLSYNLLTAYTSFVAIDTQIRLEGGRPVTVKQPLPLPQGVSDYAVGNRAFAQKTAMAPGLSHLSAALEVGEAYHEYKRECSAGEPSPTTPTSRGVPIELGNIAVTEGLSKDAIRRVLEKNMPSINRCHGQTRGTGSPLKGVVVFRLVVDSEGRVERVSLDQGKRKNRDDVRCMTKALEMLHFPAPEGGKGGVITVAFIVK